MDPSDRLLWVGGAVIAVVVSFCYLLYVGQFIAAGWGVRRATQKLPGRDGAKFHDAEGLELVEMYDRETWSATIAGSADFGFLKVDRERRLLDFEGNKTRWTVPTSALTTCRVEEARVAVTEADASENSEKRYFVVLAANGDDGPWEVGMTVVRTEVGRDTSERKYARSHLLFAKIADAV